MRTGIVSFMELDAAGKRLNGGYFLSEDEEAMRLLRRWKHRKDTISHLAEPGGVFTGGIFRIVSVSDPNRGRPYVSAKDIVQSQITPTTFLAPSMGSLLSTLELREGMVLITCSGMNLGKVIWARRDMEGLCASGDLIRIVPDSLKVSPGYLCAYLSSRFGWASIRKLIYGGHIKHIEPTAVSRIEVPRLTRTTEQRIHELVENAASNRSEAIELRKQSLALFTSSFALPDLSDSGTPQSFATFSTRSGKLSRLDAAYHSPSGVQAVKSLARCEPTALLGSIASVFQTNIFKRPYVDDSRYGYPYFSGSDLFTYAPKPRGYLNKKAPGINDYIVNRDWLLMQDAGQLGGLIGRLMRVTTQQDMSVVSNHLIRINAGNRRDSAFLFTALSSPVGYRAVVRNAFGSSIPQLESAHLSQISIPWPKESLRQQIANPVLKSWDLEDAATEHHEQAITLIEHAIQEGS